MECKKSNLCINYLHDKCDLCKNYDKFILNSNKAYKEVLEDITIINKKANKIHYI